jgi:TrmH family RNA methyltransferase
MISRQHPLARRLRALRHDPALRKAEGVIVAEGVHLAEEALASSARIEAAVVGPRLAAQDGGALVVRLLAAGVAVHEALQDARSPQPIVLLVKRSDVGIETVFERSRGIPLVVVACGMQDPGNLGSVLRTAEAAGATGFAATPGGAELTHPRAVRATMGSIFRLPAAEADAEAVVALARRNGVTLVGAAARHGTPYDALDWTRPCALLLGSEGAGLPPEIAARLDAHVTVPMRDPVESLSVGAAAAVLLFEAARRRRLP